MKTLKDMLKRASVVAPILELLLLPFLAIAIIWFRIAKFVGFSKTPLTKWLVHKLGMLPVVDHYYEPLFQFGRLTENYDKERVLPEIDWNIEQQLSILKQFRYQRELEDFPLTKKSATSNSFYHTNGSFGYTDAEYLYSFIRLMQPKRIIEVGSGFSTLMMIEAQKANRKEQRDFQLTCVEPFEMSWLEALPIKLVRKKIEDIPTSLFTELEEGDILFIDSSHIIRPEGDVLHQLFNILPVLKPGVIIHFHDIFTPHHYPKRWLEEEYRLWNEQYLVEAFLANNSEYKIIGGLNYLSTHSSTQFFDKFPISKKNGMLPGSSLWIQKGV